jgi:hypothetical protein
MAKQLQHILQQGALEHSSIYVGTGAMIYLLNELKGLNLSSKPRQRPSIQGKKKNFILKEREYIKN